MKLEIKNLDLVNVINFLDSLELAGLKGIHRTNLNLKLQKQLEHVMDAEKQISEELKDDKEQRNKDLKALHEECAVIDTGDSQTMLNSVKNTIKEVVSKGEDAFKGKDAYGLATLYNAFELDVKEGDNE